MVYFGSAGLTEFVDLRSDDEGALGRDEEYDEAESVVCMRWCGVVLVLLCGEVVW